MVLVCPDCFGEEGLKRRIIDIRPKFDEGSCQFHPSKKGVPVSEVAKIVDEVFRNAFALGDYESYSGEPKGEDLTTTLYDLTEADDDRVVQYLADALIESDDYWPPDGEESFYDHDRGYVRHHYGFQEHNWSWELFRREILHEQRFFNERALTSLIEIFEGLHLLRDNSNSPAVYEIGVGDVNGEFWRARKANSYDEQKKIALDPAKGLGPPPHASRTAGRMNPSGILTFYGAFDLKTCVAEIRPAVGETVVAAKFALQRPIFVLDTTKFDGRPKAINMFTKTFAIRMRLWNFMANFMDEISKPSLQSNEHLEYIPTQVVSEYLTRLHRFKVGEKNVSVDAIIYRSAQNGAGKNIAIFGQAAVVEGSESGVTPKINSAKPGLRVVPGSVQSHSVTNVSHGIAASYIPGVDTPGGADHYEPDF